LLLGADRQQGIVPLVYSPLGKLFVVAVYLQRLATNTHIQQMQTPQLQLHRQRLLKDQPLVTAQRVFLHLGAIQQLGTNTHILDALAPQQQQPARHLKQDRLPEIQL
jgi:hypothetical protein